MEMSRIGEGSGEAAQMTPLLGWMERREGIEGENAAGRKEEQRRRFANRSLRAGETSFRGQLLLALFVLAVCWGSIALFPAIGWATLIVLAAWFRTAYPRAVRKRGATTDELRNALLVGASVSALAWSVGLIWFLPSLGLPRLFLTVAVVSAMVTASSITMAADRRAFAAFSGILLGALAIGIVLNGRSSVHWLGIAFIVADAAWVTYVFRGTHRAVRLEIGYAMDLEAHENQLQRERSFLSALLESLSEAVVVLHRDGLIMGVNLGFEEMFGWTAKEAVGRDIFQLLVPTDQRDEIQERIHSLMDRGVTQVRTAQRMAKDGRMLWTRLSASTIQGEPDLAVILYSDVTPLKEAQDELEQAKEMAEEANRAKSEFLATMSHEIRTPMNAIIGMADLLAETSLSATQRDYVEVFRTAGDTLLTLINQVLDLSKIESGHLELDVRDFDLWDLVDRTAQVFAIPAHQKGVELAARVDPDVPRWVRGDPDRLRQVLANLIGNAVKFTSEGEVVLEVRPANGIAQEPAPSSTVRLRVEVRDTGPGIPADRKDDVFERFTQADSSTTRMYGGTGLGLTISKALVSMMSGEMSVESEEGVGSTFYFDAPFPVGVPQEAHRERADSVEVEGLKVLVVDDNATNRLILQEILTGWGAHPVAVSGGAEALEVLDRATEGGSGFDVVLLDGQMPGMDGFELAERIRVEPGIDGATLLMLTSSENHAEEVQRARDLGIESYLVKPVRRPELLEAILAALGVEKGGADEGPPEAPPVRAGEGVSILLVEDTFENQMLVEAYVAKTPHALHSVDRGQKAIDAYTADPAGFDLVFMDIQMPGLDGYEVTRAIRAFEAENGLDPVPIVALTAHALESERRKSEEAGCDAHLTKPIKKKDLLAAIPTYARTPSEVRQEET